MRLGNIASRCAWGRSAANRKSGEAERREGETFLKPWKRWEILRVVGKLIVGGGGDLRNRGKD